MTQPMTVYGASEAELEAAKKVGLEFAVTTPQQYAEAGQWLVRLKNLMKGIEAYFAPQKQALRAAWQEKVDEEKQVLAPLEKSERDLKAKLLAYDREEERKRRELEEKLRREAEEEARKKREVEAKAREAQAKRLEKKGNVEAAADLRAAPLPPAAPPPPVHVASSTPKVAGIRRVKTWRARIVDASKIPVEDVTKPSSPGSPITRGFWTLDEARLQAFAKSTKGALGVPGVQFYEDEGLAAGGAA